MSFAEQIYDDIDKAISVFRAKAWPACPPGCGECCEHFQPDITEVEAAYLAAYILLVKPELAGLLETASERVSGRGGSGCPLYDPTRAEHCPVYPARPLVCRGFAFSAVTGKKGPVYRLCSKMPDRYRGRRDWCGEDIVREFGLEAPVLDRYGGMIEAGGGGGGKRALLSEAVRRGLLKIRYYSGLSDPAPLPSTNDFDSPRSA